MTKKDDLVEILPNYFFPGVVGKTGKIIQVLGWGSALVLLPKREQYMDLRSAEAFGGTIWCICQEDLKILDSPADDALGHLEEILENERSNLLFARSLLAYSEELREIQAEEIDRLSREVQALEVEISILKKGKL